MHKDSTLCPDLGPARYMSQSLECALCHTTHMHSPQIVTKLHSLLDRFMLRRVKDQVHLSLPPKVEALVYTPLSVEQVRNASRRWECCAIMLLFSGHSCTRV